MLIQLNENPDYDKVIARYKNMKVNWESFAMKVLPINFNLEHKTMLAHCKMLVEDGCIAIILSMTHNLLRTAIEDNGMLGLHRITISSALRYYKINQSENRVERALVQKA
jgi:hypothetical protein